MMIMIGYHEVCAVTDAFLVFVYILCALIQIGTREVDNTP